MAQQARPVPFTTFNFKVNLELSDSGAVICDAEFADCDGLEISHEPKSIREGGNNNRQIHLAGPVSYGQLTLKRGMTSDFGLWTWFERVQAERGLRASGEVRMLASHQPKAASDEAKTDVRFRLTGCLPTRIKAPALAAKDGQIAIEEMTLVYETLVLESGGS